ncbi:MAG: GrpB family protein [Lachnospiraceae bacterium]|nr:GrpB family protein [Lachnospiraceae bacterium]
MEKTLNEMSLEELWRLFPIFLVEHKREWQDWYGDEKENILSLLPKGMGKRISHIGSTAIPGIWAKNIVDILLETEDREGMLKAKEVLADNGWICMSQEADRISMNKGYTKEGFAEKVFHIHIRLFGDNSELYFRDYLCENLKAAKEYEQLKLSLQQKFEYNRDGYTEAKSEFIQKYTDIARKKYSGRYKGSYSFEGK